MTSLEEEEEAYESEDEEPGTLKNREPKKHWCNTCRGEIKYEDLGLGKVFRVKVYASNGLMKAGAWAACWKEMERVDIEIEPVVESELQDELERFAALQIEEQEQRQQEELREHEGDTARRSADRHALVEHDEEHLPTECAAESSSNDKYERSALMSSPAVQVNFHTSLLEPLAAVTGSPITVNGNDIDASEERRLRDEERLREIYGRTPPRPQREPPTSCEYAESPGLQPQSSYIPQSTPPSPSEQAFERRGHRQNCEFKEHLQSHDYPDYRRPSYQTASLLELLVECAKVLMRDRKNVVIAILVPLILLLAVRSSPPASPPGIRIQSQDIVYRQEPEVFVRGEDPVVSTIGDVLKKSTLEAQQEAEPIVVAESGSTSLSSIPSETVEDIASKPSVHIDPCESPHVGSQAPDRVVQSQAQPPPPKTIETLTEKEIVRVIETVTETQTVKVTASAAAETAETTNSKAADSVPEHNSPTLEPPDPAAEDIPLHKTDEL
jgi:hypothetical protein